LNKKSPTLSNEFETDLRRRGYRIIIGIDEAGRGPLAGPVVASAVALKEDSVFDVVIRDSKKMSLLQREKAFCQILDKAYVGVGMMAELVIDRYNILQATYKAMDAAIYQLLYRLKIDGQDWKSFKNSIMLLVDGNSFKTEFYFPHKTVVKGDSSVLSIACASIVAKVTRDRILKVYDRVYPEYGFQKHKGYPTREHRLKIQEHGLSSIHRKSFQVKI
jgi:ribonuclease HII